MYNVSLHLLRKQRRIFTTIRQIVDDKYFAPN